MKIYCKATVYAVKDVADNLSKDELEEAHSNLETDMRLDIESMQTGGSSDYTYVSDVGSVSKEELANEDSFLFDELQKQDISVSDRKTAENIYLDLCDRMIKHNTHKVGTLYYPFDSDGVNEWAIVFGYMDGFTDDPKDKDYTQFCGKVAYQAYNNVMQCDYDVDWTMPYDEKTGEVDDTNIAITSPDDVKWLLDQAVRLRGKTPVIKEPIKKNTKKDQTVSR